MFFQVFIVSVSSLEKTVHCHIPMHECRFVNSTHVFMVLLEVDELFFQGFDLALQVHAAHVGVVDELPQTDDVCLHRLADGQLRLISEKQEEEENFRVWYSLLS